MKKLRLLLKKNRIAVLENQWANPMIRGRYVYIVGIKDITTNDANISKALKGTNKFRPRIVITHNPDVYYDILDNVAVIFAGHTHGGQVVLPKTPAMFVPSRYGSLFASGHIKPQNNHIIISRGLGTDKVPFRLFCQPEIVIVDFVKTGKAKKK